MGQILSFLFQPRVRLRRKNLLFKGDNSAIYCIPNKRVCKVVINYKMYIREKLILQYLLDYETDGHTLPENIVHVYTIPYGYTRLIYERCDMDLLEWIVRYREHPLYRHFLLDFMKQLANGYRFLYENSIEHYDIKPDNLLVSACTHDRFVLKITDFGTSCQHADRYQPTCGTWGYMAPEVIGFTCDLYYVPHSMDVYSICIMFAYFFYSGVHRIAEPRLDTFPQYMEIESYIRKKHHFPFLSRGLVCDQRFRLPITDLLFSMSTDFS